MCEENNLTGRTAEYYVSRLPGAKPLNSGRVHRHELGIVSIVWTKHWQHDVAWSNWSEKEVNYFVFMGWLVFGPPKEDDDGMP